MGIQIKNKLLDVQNKNSSSADRETMTVPKNPNLYNGAAMEASVSNTHPLNGKSAFIESYGCQMNLPTAKWLHPFLKKRAIASLRT